MKAIVCEKYGPPESLVIKDVPKPVPTNNEVLVRIITTAINDYDWSMVRGKPAIYRLLFGLGGKPKNPIPGMELAGIVEDVGPDVHSLKVGDEVFGDTSDHSFGTFAEYIAVSEDALRLKPPALSFVDAVAIPHAGALAYQALVEVGKMEENNRVLINGAGGGVGTFGLQLAKGYGAEVTGVDTGAKLQMMTSLGFDEVIDYRTMDFTGSGQSYDLIIDNKTGHSPWSYLSVLKEGGRYVSVGGEVSRLLQLFLLKMWIKLTSSKSLHIVALKANKDLSYLGQLAVDGGLKPIIDGPYDFESIPERLEYFGTGKHTGKVVIKVGST